MIPDPDDDNPETTPELHRWDRMNGETERGHAAFSVYRELGPLRSLRKAAAAFYEAPDGKPTDAQLSQLKKWSSDWGWVKRVRAWDQYLDRVSMAEQIEAIREMNRRHAQAAFSIFEQAMGPLLSAGVRMTIPQALQAVEIASKLERQARGAAALDAEPADPDSFDSPDAKRERLNAMLEAIVQHRIQRAAESTAVHNPDVSCTPGDEPT